MNERRSWLCPTEIDRTRVVEAGERVSKARIFIWGVIGVSMAALGPWVGWWTLLLLGAAGIWLAALEVWLRRTDHPERLAVTSILFNLGLFAVGIAFSGGPHSPLMPLIMIPISIAPMRFRGTVVLALAALATVLLLAVTVGTDPRGAAADPSLIITTIALLISLTAATWALVEAEMKQRDAAVLDPLTGLLNRKAFEVRAAELEQQAQLTGGGSVALIACDIDCFKHVNDTYGHDRGDAVLKSVAYEMRKTLRTFELFYRLGGEEFLILLPGHSLLQGQAMAERLRQTVEAARPGGLDLTISFGVSGAAGADVDYKRLYKSADEALYRAKAAGRNCVVTAGRLAPSPEPEPEPALAPVG